MAQKGLERRAAVEDNLAGQADIKPVFLRGGGIRAPSTPRKQASPASAMVAALGNFAGEQLKRGEQHRRERAALDGATMAVQGVAFDQVETGGGDKWAAEGHALMTGSMTSSAMVAAQVMQIEQGGYAMSADQFRGNYVNRMDDAIRSLPPGNEAAATAIRDEFTKQMPALIEKHTVKHAEYVEKQTYDTLVNSIDVVSRDPTGEDKLLNFAGGGEDSASGFLSAERRASAVARGVQVAFRNENPRAYGILRMNGLLEQMTLEQRNSVEASRQAFQNRALSKGNDKMVAALQGIDDAIASGLSGEAASLRTAEVLAEWDVDITHQMQAAIYAKAADVENTEGMIVDKQLQSAMLAKDYEVAGEITADVMEWTESRGQNVEGQIIKSGANKGTRAHGSTQITTLTSQAPGFGVRPAANTTPEELRRTGRDYWKAMFKGKELGIGNLPWEAGDWVAAGAAYNWGPKKAKAWYLAGADQSKLPQETKEWLGRYKARLEKLKHPTVNAKYNTAVAMLSAAKGTAVVEATDTYNQVVKPFYETFKQSDGGPEAIADLRVGLTAARDEAGLAMSSATVAQEAARSDAIGAAIRKDRDEREADRVEAAYNAEMVDPILTFKTAMEAKNGTAQTRSLATTQFLQDSAVAMENAGVQEVNKRYSKLFEKITSVLGNQSQRLQQAGIDDALIENAIKNKTIGELSPNNQATAFNRIGGVVDRQLDEALIGVEDQAARDDISNAAFAEMMLSQGIVDPQMKASLSAHIMRGLVDEKTGKVHPEAVAAIKKYQALRDIDVNQSVLEDFLTEDARALAEAAIAMAGPGGLIEEGMQFVGLNLNPQTTAQIDAIVKAEAMEEAIAETVEARAETDIVGYFSAMFSDRSDFTDVGNFTPSEQRSLTSDEMQERQVQAVTSELRRLVMKHPKNKPAHLLEMARNNVAARSANIGSDWIVMKDNIKEAMFGSKVANFDKNGIEHQVVMEWLASPEMKAVHEGIGEVGVLEQIIPFAGELGMSDAAAALRRGVRPFKMYVTPTGQLVAQITSQDGNVGDNIFINLEAAGINYMKNHSPLGE